MKSDTYQDNRDPNDRWRTARKKPKFVEFRGPYQNTETVATIEGDFEVDEDYIEEHGGYVIIRGVEDEIYPCGLDIFRQTYEQVHGSHGQDDAFYDVEIFVRPADVDSESDQEQTWAYSYKDLAHRTKHNVIDFVTDTVENMSEGQWVVGVRERGDETYQQQFMVIGPHADEHGTQLVGNHLQGVLRHWRG